MITELSIQLTIAFRLLISFVAGMLIGYDRERSGKVAGLKTQMLVCVGSALFASLSIFIADSLGVLGQDPTRIMAQVVTGVGFLGAGVIIKNGNRLSGVTTAATIWTTAAVGVAIGSGFYIPAALTVFLILMLNPIAFLQYKYGTKGFSYSINFDKKDEDEVLSVMSQLYIREIQKSVNQDDIHIHVLSTDQKNDKFARILKEKKIKYSLESAEE